MSVTTSLSYISAPEAITLKILWVIVGVAAVSLFNFKFLPYSVEKETRNNLEICYRINEKSIDLVRQKCHGGNAKNKTTLFVSEGIVRENIQVNDDNMIKHQQVLLSFINLFEKYFDIIEVLYDVSKFFYFKIKMQARRIGLLTKNKFMNLDIEIKERKSVISNECQSLFFLNHNSYRDKYQIREGIIVIFYITDI
jgi:hypothetical protein